MKKICAHFFNNRIVFIFTVKERNTLQSLLISSVEISVQILTIYWFAWKIYEQ